jgi:hypothetical protein
MWLISQRTLRVIVVYFLIFEKIYDMSTKFTRADFMKFFRDDEMLNQLTVEDRIEVFSTILLGNSDFTKSLFDEIFSDYCVTHLEVIETNSLLAQ